jgi:regulatory protein
VGDGPGDDRDFTAADVRRRAMDLLARREHARRELAAKLRSRGMPADMVESVLDDLGRENLLSDARFAESFIAARVGRGQGPVRIRMELEQKGVGSEAIAMALDNASPDWGELAAAARSKRFGRKPPRDFHERARQARFLQYRGFASDHISRALDAHEGGDD